MARLFLAMNGKRINTLEDLRENFNVKQMLAFYKSKRLHSWLEEQSCSEILENINSFEPDYDDDTLLSMLMAVFELDDEQIAKVAPKVAPPGADPVATESTAPISDPENTSAAPAVVPDPVVPESAGGLTWQVCQLGKEENNGKVVASCQVLAESELDAAKIISGPKQKYNISSAFFFDGYFWAQIFRGVLYCDNTAWMSGEDGCGATWVKSKDGIQWEIDTTLKKLLDDFGNVDRIKICDKHVFMLESSVNGKSAIAYSQAEGWREIKFDTKIISAPENDTYENRTNLEDIYEHKNHAGIVCVQYQDSLQDKDSLWGQGECHEIYHCSDLSQCNDGDFGKLSYKNCEHGDVFVYPFRNFLFVTSDGNDSTFMRAEFDQKDPTFQRVELPDGIIVNNCAKFFTFPETMFVISTDSWGMENKGKLLFTKDGLEWKKCEIDSETIIDVVFVNNCYFAIADEDGEDGIMALFQSETGDRWQKIRTFSFSHRDRKTIAVAGNNMLLLWNGSASGKYLLIRIGSAGSSSPRNVAAVNAQK